jgi:Family of unknown function (DUF6519)
MVTITTSTFDPLLGYVNVRLQQGVPIVDADWNEQDDIRKFELRAFLKWYVGDGIPDGNDGFRIVGGLDNDFTIAAGAPAPPSGTPVVDTGLRHAGRCIVDGLDVLIPADRKFTDQPLHEVQPGAAALAARLGVPVVTGLTRPTADGQFIVYLDVWERLVTPDEIPDLVHAGLGVETCARMRREWVVRVAAGTSVPTSGSAVVAGHAYLPLAVLTRRSGVDAIDDDDISDRRQRRLLLPPAHLLTDTLGTDPLAYRRGEGRPPISLRQAINALLAGQLPSTPDLAVSPAPGVDVVRRAFVVDAAGGLVTIWQSPRVASTNQIFGSRLDLHQLEVGFSVAQPLTSGTARLAPTAVALPNGELVVAYQNGLSGAATTDVVMKRAAFAGLAGAVEEPVAATNGAADESPHAVLAGDQVVFFTHQASTNTWRYRRYRHTDATFLDTNPQQLSAVTTTTRDLHAAAVTGGQVWVAFSDGSNLQLLRLVPGSGTVDAVASVPGAAVDPFVLGISATEALVFWDDNSALRVVAFSGTAWGSPAAIVGTDSLDAQPAAVRDAEGTVFLLSTRQTTDAGTEIFLRRRNPVTGEWGQPQRVISSPANDLRPHPVLVPDQGIWVLWLSNRTGDFDLFAKRLITAI